MKDGQDLQKPCETRLFRHSSLTSRKLNILLGLLSVPLFVLALVYNVAGFTRLVQDTPGSYPIDLRLRWVEQRLVSERVNPQLYGHPDAKVRETHPAMVEAGGSYPPWSYATSMLLVPPFEWKFTRLYFAVINIFALCVVCYWAAQSVRDSVPLAGLVGPLAVASIFSIAICVSYGQYALLITAFLAAGFLLADRGYDICSGLCLGLGMVKPQLAAPFVLAMLLRGKVRVVAWAVIYVLLASCVTAYFVRANPVTMFRNVSHEAALYADLSHNPFILMLQRKLGFGPATWTAAAGGLLIIALIVFPLRKNPSPLAALSVCTVVCMFWSYRKHYDVVLLAFPLIHALNLTCRRSSWLAGVVFFSIGGSVWLPIRDAQWHWPVVAYSHAAIWVIGVTLLVGLDWKESKERRAARLVTGNEQS